MAEIRILDDHIANQIAAGEVVERPSSVVKELVENAIDAGSTTIDVTIEEGGLKLIKVVDNGSGIAPEDVHTAFLRHATSKISSGKDLFRIVTLGFRGEALPSIAAVSKVECLTSINNSGLGRRFIIEGGSVLANEEASAPMGTTFAVRELFFNTPARLKYMKTVQTELGHVSDYMYRLSMAHPSIAFTFRHNGTILLQTLGNGDLLQVVAAVYGSALAKQLIPIEGENPDYSISGLVSLPELNRSSRNSVSTFLNGRYIRNFAVAQAVLEAYHTLLPIHRFPLAALHIQMDASLLDVNVHPAKLEVRFSKEAELVQFITRTIKESLHRQVLIPSAIKLPPVQSPFIQEKMDLYRPVTSSTLSDVNRKISSDTITGARPSIAQSPTNRTSLDVSVPAKISKWTQVMEKSESEAFVPAPKPVFPHLNPIGQLHGTYVVAQNESGLFLIDQHAAHERINYEYYYDRFGAPPEASQQLLVPITFEFTSAEAELLKQKLPLFEQVGVVFEPFGGSSFIVRAYPHWFPQGEEQQILLEMTAWVLSEKKAVDIAKLRENAAIMCSCKASLKANHSMQIKEMEALLDRLATCRVPYTCPHGRPIVVSFSTYELEKMFKRVM
jgi:DNA mismatch repair protein MutL